MTCLLKNDYNKQLVSDLSKIVGSEEAAYYLLTSNNGYTLDRDPNGMPSALYSVLLNNNGGNVEKTIREKALAFLPLFVEKYGDWFTDYTQEPFMSDVLPYTSIDNDSLNSILKDTGNLQQIQKALSDMNVRDNAYCINEAFTAERDGFINSYIEDLISDNPTLTLSQIYSNRIDARLTYDKATLMKITGEMQRKLAKSFGLILKLDEYGNYYYESEKDDEDSKLRVNFVNSIRYNSYFDEQGKEHKGAFVEKGVRNATMNLIYVSLENGDISTFVHEFGHYYIRQFWYSSEIQNALKEYDDLFDNKHLRENDEHIKRVEERVVNELTGRVMKDVNRSKVGKFWNTFKKVIDRAIGQYIRKDSKNIMDIITSNFYINKDLEDAEADAIFYRKVEDIMFQDPVSVHDKNSFYNVRDVINSRIAAINKQQIPDKDLLYSLERRKALLSGRDSDNSDDIVLTISEILDDCSREIIETIQTLGNIKSNGIQSINPREFLRMKTDIIGYYDSILGGSVMNELFGKTQIRELMPGSALYNSYKQCMNILNQLKKQYDLILGDYVDYKIDSYADHLVDMVPDTAEGNNSKTLRELFKYNAKLWARNLIKNGDLMSFESWLGGAINSRSPLIRLLDYIIRETNQIVETDALARGHKLVDLWNKANSLFSSNIDPRDRMKVFCEMDDAGKPTGNFVQRINYGLAYQRRDAQIEELAKKYKLTRNDDNELQFPDRDTYLAFYDEFEDWMGKNFHRRYTADYYKLRRHMLSPETLERQSQVQSQIDFLISKATDPDLNIVLLSRLTPEEQDALKVLQLEKLDLANPYIIKKDSNGRITSIVEKTGDALKAAEEIQAFNSAIKDKIEYKPDIVKFQSDLQAVESKFGVNSYEVLKFKYDNTKLSVTQEAWDKIGSVSQSEEVNKLRARRRAILNSVKKNKGYGMPSLELLSDEAWAELKRIDEELGKLAINKNPGSQFKDVANMSDVTIDINGTKFSYYQYLYQQYFAQGKLNEFNDKFYYKIYDTDGSILEVKPLSVFRFMDVDDKYIDELPSGRYSKPEGVYVDSKYTEQDESFALPDEDIYINHQYDQFDTNSSKYNKELDDFYREILQTMKDACQMLPGLSSRQYFTMPQVRDNNYRIMTRTPGALGKVLGQEFIVTEDQTLYNENFATRPDGTVVQSVPIRWIKRLDNPAIISTDILSTVISFYEMALNYNEKNNIAPFAELLLFQTKEGFSGQNDTSELYKRMLKQIQMYVYDRMRKGFTNGRMSVSEQVLSRVSEKVQSQAHSKLMSHNWRTVAKNAMDSAWNTIGEIFGGKYINWKDSLFAFEQMGKELFNGGIVGNIGMANTYSKIASSMQYNGVDSVGEIFKGLRSSRIRRILAKHLKMGEYTFVDYTFKGFFTAAIYHHHRFMTNPYTGNREFLNQELAEAAYISAGLSAKEGYKAWSDSKITLWDAYTLDKNGNFTLKSSFENVVRPFVPSLGRRSRKLETRIRTNLSERSAINNGLLDKMDKSALSQNYMGCFLLLMRGWQVTQSWDKWKTGTDFSQYQRVYELENQQLPFNPYVLKDKLYKQLHIPTKRKNMDFVNMGNSEEYDGTANLSTGYVENGIFISQLKGVKKILKMGRNALRHLNSTHLTNNEKYALKRTSMAVLAFALSSLFTILAGKWWEDDKNSMWRNWLYTIAVSSLSERSGYIIGMDIATFMDLVKKPAVAITIIDDLDSVFDMLYYTFFDSGNTGSEYVKRGSYKGESILGGHDRTEYEKSVLKASSILCPELSPNNIVKNTSEQGNKSSQNWYMSVFPTSYFTYTAQTGKRPKKAKGFVNWITNNNQNINSNQQSTNWFLKGLEENRWFDTDSED